MGYRFNPPPNWPAPPPGWIPSAGWRPSPKWPAPPPGWQLWIDDAAPAPGPASDHPQHPVDTGRRRPVPIRHTGPSSHYRFNELRSMLARHKVWTGIAAFMAVSIIVYAANPHPAGNSVHQASARATTFTAADSPRPPATPHPVRKISTRAAASSTTARQPSFPPETLAAFRAFAATGDASEVHMVGTSTEGLPSCPVPNFFVTVSSALTTREVEADLSAFFVEQGLLGNQCQAFVFAYHSRSDYNANVDNGYTAGRVALTTNGGSGPPFNLEVDAGDVYDFPPEFNFNF